ncbi:hypothetical protein [Methyloversatilis sp.]|uniref:hypothetical protein n=1 Tax=Methyloversatilis sp. TaxID=2569862 RepID=UPI002736E70D|nr:hypothetical protein [Methyloversatilis sp.]MDP2869783.1 hypothetical protein [Methyloversatilis sp.]MDP3289251.1 hypothetical protein [Methyloversatilis sp.]MDP3456463.1 hypothetical protein [Methyloversatilis sp.]MDP3576737.1 hypothetical protein [Methyloversatilis sp.]
MAKPPTGSELHTHSLLCKVRAPSGARFFFTPLQTAGAMKRAVHLTGPQHVLSIVRLSDALKAFACPTSVRRVSIAADGPRGAVRRRRSRMRMLVNTFAAHLLAGLIALTTSGLAAAGAAAATDTPSVEADAFPAEERDRLRQRASDLKVQASELRRKADADRAAADALCWQRTLVSSCIEEADETLRLRVTEVRKLELEARDIERDLRTRSAQARRAEKQRTADERRLKSIEMSVKTRETEQAQTQQREQEARERAQKDAETEARARLKAQESARKEAERAAGRQREDARAAERAADQQRHADKIDERVRRKEAQRVQREAEAAAKASSQPQPPH